MSDLICPNCGASASLPWGMTCDDHQPQPVEANEMTEITECDDWTNPGDGIDREGLGSKYHVARSDGRDQEGQPHHGCELFVLDLTHDPHARAAALAYADSAEWSRQPLADDLRSALGRLAHKRNEA